jgi:hypothetical protein
MTGEAIDDEGVALKEALIEASQRVQRCGRRVPFVVNARLRSPPMANLASARSRTRSIAATSPVTGGLPMEMPDSARERPPLYGEFGPPEGALTGF